MGKGEEDKGEEKVKMEVVEEKNREVNPQEEEEVRVLPAAFEIELEDREEQDRMMRHFIREAGFIITEMSQYGNCFFESLQRGLWSLGITVPTPISAIRARIAIGLQDNRLHPYVQRYFHPSSAPAMSLDQEAAGIADQLWGNDLCIMIASIIWRVRIIVITPPAAFHFFQPENATDDWPTIYLSYHYGNHYNYLRRATEVELKIKSETGDNAKINPGFGKKKKEVKIESVKTEAIKTEAIKTEAIKREGVKQETVKKEEVKEENEKQKDVTTKKNAEDGKNKGSNGTTDIKKTGSGNNGRQPGVCVVHLNIPRINLGGVTLPSPAAEASSSPTTMPPPVASTSAPSPPPVPSTSSASTEVNENKKEPTQDRKYAVDSKVESLLECISKVNANDKETAKLDGGEEEADSCLQTCGPELEAAKDVPRKLQKGKKKTKKQSTSKKEQSNKQRDSGNSQLSLPPPPPPPPSPSRHQKMHDSRVCGICGDKFPTSRERVSHQNTIHGKLGFKCSKCDKCFQYLSQLHRHIRDCNAAREKDVGPDSERPSTSRGNADQEDPEADRESEGHNGDDSSDN